MDDTPPEITKKMNELYEMKSPEERFKMSSSMHATSKYLIIRAILEKNPNISKTRLKQEFFFIFYGSDFDLATQNKILKYLES